jgi:hypothetical protein
MSKIALRSIRLTDEETMKQELDQLKLSFKQNGYTDRNIRAIKYSGIQKVITKVPKRKPSSLPYIQHIIDRMGRLKEKKCIKPIKESRI